MRELSIAYGNSRSAKQWSNKTIRFEDLKERLKVTIRTSESAEEYARFPKSKKDAVPSGKTLLFCAVPNAAPYTGDFGWPGAIFGSVP